MSAERGQWREPFRIQIDFDQLIWQALQAVNTSFQSPEFTMGEEHTKFGGRASSRSHVSLERYEDNVLIVKNYILEEWILKDNLGYPMRYAKWVALFKEYTGRLDVYRQAHDDWFLGKKDPMLEPIKPASPGEPPKPFSVEIEDCFNEQSGWQPFKLHRAIIQFLHRRDFFKRTDNIELIEGVTQEPGSQEPETLSGEQSVTVGSLNGGTSELTTEKMSAPS